MVSENFEEPPNESHNHYCIDELTSMVDTELHRLYKLWNDNDLSCAKIKKVLRENDIGLYDLACVLGKINEEIKGSLQK